MIRPSRKLHLSVALLAAASIAQAQSFEDEFQQGVDLFRRGRNEEALAAMQRALGEGPSEEQAYELWLNTPHEVWLDLMVEGGELELAARRVIELAKAGKQARRNDAEAIRALLDDLRAEENAIERRRIVRKLAADHGEYAVPAMVRVLGDPKDDEWRVTVMSALKDMDTDVVVPLLEALRTDDPYQRRNIVQVLGLIGDPRAAGWLSALAAGDPDGGVVEAAREAALRCGATGDALAHFLRDGDDYHHRRQAVLRDYDYSDVVWNWEDGQLVSEAIPLSIYNDEMSRRSYERALILTPGSLEALAGLARAYLDMEAKLTVAADSGEDVDELLTRVREGAVAVNLAGVDALDLALQWSVIGDDTGTAVRVSRVLGGLSSEMTPGLRAALESNDGAVAAEAAVAAGQIAWTTQQGVSANVVQILGRVAGREVVRVVAIIDANLTRADAVVKTLSAKGVLVNHRDGGSKGLAMLRLVPGVDAVLVGDGLRDMTLDQVLSDIAGNSSMEAVPVLLMTANGELASAYEDRVTATIADSDGLVALDEVFSARLEGDRAEALALAQRAAEVLAHLAQAGSTDVGPALNALASTLSGRPQEVLLPAVAALGAAGTTDQLGALIQTASDPDREDAVRIAAADAIGSIVARAPDGGRQAGALAPLLTSDASLEVRNAIASALGRARLGPQERVALIKRLQGDVEE